ncbi:MAG: DUF3048 domain-containing protein [Armatimonadota bacterium]|nr:DUF3048 domain-containing protein [Armatimonadota bacterium]
MTLQQRLGIWAATLAVVLAAAAFAWRSLPRDEVWLRLREPSLPLPDPNQVFLPGGPRDPILLLVIENTPPARPQAGLADACLVFAVPTEARITRFLTAFCRQAPPVVGPIRSVRRYMLELAQDLGAVLVHAGFSAEAQTMIVNQRLPVINEFWTPAPFWRDPARPMPHNLYTSIDGLQTALRTRPIETRRRYLPYRFAYEHLTVPRSAAPAGAVSLDYGPLYAVRYRYDAAQRRYRREQDGRPHLDAAGIQVAPASILVLFIQWRDELVRGRPSSRINLVGHGRLVVLTEGRMAEGTWKRTVAGPLTLADASGRDIVLPPGPVWIELFPADRPFEVQAEAGS